MSIDAYVVCHPIKQFFYLGKLGSNGFTFGNLHYDPGGSKAGELIGSFLGQKLEIVRAEDLPTDYTEITEEE